MGWKKGQSGNPKGRAVEKPWTDALKRVMAQLELRDKDGKVIVKRGEALRKIAETVVERAILGDKDAWKEVGERVEGKAAQVVAGPGELGDHLFTVTHRSE